MKKEKKTKKEVSLAKQLKAADKAETAAYAYKKACFEAVEFHEAALASAQVDLYLAKIAQNEASRKVSDLWDQQDAEKENK